MLSDSVFSLKDSLNTLTPINSVSRDILHYVTISQVMIAHESLVFSCLSFLPDIVFHYHPAVFHDETYSVA